MRLRDVVISGALFGMLHGAVAPVRSEPTKGYFTMDAMGCMLLRECTDGVTKVKSISDIADAYPDSDYGIVADEFNAMLAALDLSLIHI